MEVVFQRKVNEIKPIVLDEACEFIKKQTQEVTKLLTKQHHKVV